MREKENLEKKNEVYEKSKDAELIRLNNAEIIKIQVGIDSLKAEVEKIYF
ncbi:MAG: hypothetical protein RLZZ292_2678 [Bacteroidota bacterium]|jgi:hypothetical protein